MTRINLNEQPQQQQTDGNTTDSNTNTESEYTVDLDEQYQLRHNQLRYSYYSLDFNEEETQSVQHIDCTKAIAKIQQLGHDAKVRLERVKERRALVQHRGNELIRNNSQNQPNLTEANKKANNNAIYEYGDDDLRPKFAILKHRTEILHSSTATHLNIRTSDSSPAKNQPLAKTPSWFFNIPTTRTPFPDFESKLPPEELVD